jgi:hypothetical protein
MSVLVTSDITKKQGASAQYDNGHKYAEPGGNLLTIIQYCLLNNGLTNQPHISLSAFVR